MIRGATGVEENTKEGILNATTELLNKIINENHIELDFIAAIIFTATDDLNAEYPAVAARKLGITNASLLCVREMNVVESMKKCIRLMVVVNGSTEQINAKHIYINGAEALRPDLVK